MSLLRIEFAALCINRGKSVLHRTMKNGLHGTCFYL